MIIFHKLFLFFITFPKLGSKIRFYKIGWDSVLNILFGNKFLDESFDGTK